jgi:hypothetical protein
MNVDKYESDHKIGGLSYGPNGDKFAVSSKNCAFFF